MNFLYVLGILLLLIAYIVATLVYINGREKRKQLQIIMDSSNYSNSIKTFFFEDKLLEKLQIESGKAKTVIFIERILLISFLTTSFILLRGLALALFGAIIVVAMSKDSYNKVVYESGINNIARITNFINYFVPHVSSGNSADQSFLGYVEYAGDVELANYYENRDNPEYKIPPHLKQIIDVYDIAKYNEEKGISDYIYILNELSKDMAQKQVYYNSFVSRIGEIQPIMWSYYIGVPILIGISLGQTFEFWMGFGGYIVSLILLALFASFKFLIYKLQKKTINVIF